MMVLCRARVSDAKKAGMVDRDEIVKSVAQSTKRTGLEHFDAVWANFIETNALSDRKAMLRGIDAEVGQFVLNEVLSVVQKHGTLLLYRSELTLATGDQVTLQKQKNITRAEREYARWQWEWESVIRPVLVQRKKDQPDAQEEWTFKDAYEWLLANGGIPKPPAGLFDDDDC
jgi:hypothetical protein